MRSLQPAPKPGGNGKAPEHAAGDWGIHRAVLFENLELIRTIRAASGPESDRRRCLRVAPTADSLGLPAPATCQVYGDFARPGRLALEASLLPPMVWAGR